MKSFAALSLAVFVLALSTTLEADKSVGEHVDDGLLHTKVKAAMVGHGSTGVNVEVFHGVVQLAGFLTGEGNKKNLIKSVTGVKGVKRVSDKLQLVEGDRSAGTVVDDHTVTARVKTALVDKGLAGVNVEVNRGRVLLSGFVASEEIRDKAIETARYVKGVTSVINGMDLKI